MSPSHPLVYLASLCRRWGGTLDLVSAREFAAADIEVHPLGNHGIDYEQRAIMAVRFRANPGTIVHEMGHVFLAEGNTASTYEPDWLGWEIVLARRARCYRAWSKQNADYQLPLAERDELIEWGSLRGQDQRRVIADRLELAVTLGIVSRGGVPLCTRKP